MRKRILPLLLVACMIVSMLPAVAFAEDTTTTATGATCKANCTEETHVAEIVTKDDTTGAETVTHYTSLAAAVTAAQEAEKATTITVLKSHTTSEAYTVSQGDITIVGAEGGVTVTSNLVGSDGAGADIFTVTGGKLTLGENLTIDGTKSSVLWMPQKEDTNGNNNNNGTVVLNGATLATTREYDETAKTLVTVLISGGTFIVKDGNILRENNSNAFAVGVSYGGSVTFDGGYVKAPGNALYVGCSGSTDTCVVTVNGGDFVSTGEKFGSNETGMAVAVVSP